MRYFILSIPTELQDIWWVYHIILIGVIVLSIVILSFFRKRSSEKEGNKLSKRAEKFLERAAIGHIRAIINTKTAKNLLSSAIYYYKEAIKEKEIYKLRLKIDELEKLIIEINTISSEEKSEGSVENIENTLKKLKEINAKQR